MIAFFYGLFGDLIASAQALAGGLDKQSVRPSVPICLFVMGPGLILPIRVTSISIEITEFTPALYPHLANVTLDMQVLTPEVFKCKCKAKAAIEIAIAAYKFTRLQEDALAVANISNAVSAARSMMPF